MSIFVDDPPPPLPHLSGDLQKLINKMLLKDPRSRITAKEVLLQPVLRTHLVAFSKGMLQILEPAQRASLLAQLQELGLV